MEIIDNAIDKIKNIVLFVAPFFLIVLAALIIGLTTPPNAGILAGAALLITAGYMLRKK